MSSAAGAPAYAPGAAVAATAAPDGSVVWVAQLPGGPIHVLYGVAATIWAEATTGAAAELVGRVAAAWAQDPETVRADVVAFVDDLVARGLLVTDPR